MNLTFSDQRFLNTFIISSDILERITTVSCKCFVLSNLKICPSIIMALAAYRDTFRKNISNGNLSFAVSAIYYVAVSDLAALILTDSFDWHMYYIWTPQSILNLSRTYWIMAEHGNLKSLVNNILSIQDLCGFIKYWALMEIFETEVCRMNIIKFYIFEFFCTYFIEMKSFSNYVSKFQSGCSIQFLCLHFTMKITICKWCTQLFQSNAFCMLFAMVWWFILFYFSTQFLEHKKNCVSFRTSIL